MDPLTWTALFVGSGALCASIFAYRALCSRHWIASELTGSMVRKRGIIAGPVLDNEHGNNITIEISADAERQRVVAEGTLAGRRRRLRQGDRVTVLGLPGVVDGSEEALYRQPARRQVIDALWIARGWWPELPWLRIPMWALGACCLVASIGMIRSLPFEGMAKQRAASPAATLERSKADPVEHVTSKGPPDTQTKKETSPPLPRHFTLQPQQMRFVLTPASPEAEVTPPRPKGIRWLVLQEPAYDRPLQKSPELPPSLLSRIAPDCAPLHSETVDYDSPWYGCNLSLHRVRRGLALPDGVHLTLATDQRRICVSPTAARFELNMAITERRLMLGVPDKLLREGEKLLAGAVEKGPCRPVSLAGAHARRAKNPSPAVKHAAAELKRKLARLRWSRCKVHERKAHWTELRSSIYPVRRGPDDHYLVLAIRRCSEWYPPSVAILALVTDRGQVLGTTGLVREWPRWAGRVIDFNGDGWDEVVFHRTCFELMDRVVISLDGERVIPIAGHPGYGT